MTVQELEELVAQKEALSREHGREIGTQLVIPPKPRYSGPFGKVRTPFGLCEVACVNRQNEIVVFVSLQQLRKTLAKMKKAAELL